MDTGFLNERKKLHLITLLQIMEMTLFVILQKAILQQEFQELMRFMKGSTKEMHP